MKKILYSVLMLMFVGLLGANEYVNITFRLSQSDVYVAVNNSDPVFVRGREVVIQQPRLSESIVSFSKQNFLTKRETVYFTQPVQININLQQGTSDIDFRQPGFVTVDANQPGAEIFANSIKIGTVPAQIQLTAGNHTLSIRKELYHPFEREINLAERGIQDLGRVNLRENFGYYRITTNPSDALIFMDGQRLGYSPIARTRMRSGSYNLLAVKELYHDKEFVMELKDNDDRTFNINLVPAFGTLIIESRPESGADVYLGERRVGITPYTNDRCPSGEYLISIEKELWIGDSKTVPVNDNQTTRAVLELSQDFGTLIVRAEGSKIYINDLLVGNDRVTKNLRPGDHIIRAEREYHQDATDRISLRAGEEINRTLKPEPKMGTFSIVSNPFATRGATIFFNNERRQEKTPAVIETIMGAYNITVSYPGYIDRTRRSIFLAGGEHKELEFNLMLYKGSSLHKSRTWKTRKWVSFYSAVILAGGGVAANFMGDIYYKDYKNSTTTSDAVSNRENYERWYNYRDISYYVSILPAATFFYSWIKQGYYGIKADKQMRE